MTTQGTTTQGTTAPRAADGFLEALALRDFPGIAAAVGDTAHLTALLPRGPSEADGPEAISGAFRGWFGGADRFEVVATSVGTVAGRLHLSWRVAVEDPARGRGPLLLEQQLYADAGPDGRLTRLALLCSGFCPLDAATTGSPVLAGSPR